MELLECLAAQLPSLPDPSLFADVGSAPAAPGDAAQAAAWSAAAAAHLQLLAELVARLDAVALGMEALAASGSSQAGSEAPGSLRIEELDAAAPTSRLPATLVLAAALFGSSDPQLQPLRPWAAEPAAAAAQQLLVALAGKLAAVLEQRRREVQPSAQPGVLLQEVSTTLSTTSKAASGPQPQPEAVQQLLALALPPAVQQLRPVVAAKVEHAKHKTARLEPYTGACISLLFVCASGYAVCPVWVRHAVCAAVPGMRICYILNYCAFSAEPMAAQRGRRPALPPASMLRHIARSPAERCPTSAPLAITFAPACRPRRL